MKSITPMLPGEYEVYVTVENSGIYPNGLFYLGNLTVNE
jgi:hypothetical protein